MEDVQDGTIWCEFCKSRVIDEACASHEDAAQCYNLPATQAKTDLASKD